MGRLHKKKIWRRSPLTGVSLIELMVTLVIAGGILSTALFYLNGYLPRARLNRAALDLRNFLVRAKERAKDRQEPLCITLKRLPLTQPVVFQLWKDEEDVDPNTWELICGGSRDTLVETLTLYRSIQIPNCSTTGATAKCPLWQTPGQTFIKRTGVFDSLYQLGDCEIILSSTELASGVKAREVEILGRLGRIVIVPVGELGLGRSSSKGKKAGPAPSPLPPLAQRPAYCQQ